MFKMSDAKGVCSNCRHADTCGNRRSNELLGHAVWMCEEHELELETNEHLPGREDAVRPEVVNTPNALPERSLGLCINCDLRETCTLPSAPGGVWHCEEYQ